jgi:gamma-glutamyl phosphate reductase
MSPTELRQEAIRLLNDALQRPPAELKAEVDVAETAIARLRDELIDRLRAGDTSVRPALDNVNAVLSLVVGIEYPAQGVQRPLLQQAHDALLNSASL